MPPEFGSRPYGTDDASFQAAGGEAGIRQLVDDFYAAMAQRPDAQRILHMHPENLAESRRKLTFFLCGWLGGPKLFSQNYYPIRIPMAHQHLDIGEAERDAWMNCMADAVAKQPYAEDFKVYLLEQLFVPAERVRMVSQARQQQGS